MNAFPKGTGPPRLDWARWWEILQRYAAATGLTVSLYDEHSERKSGPTLGTPFARVLAGSHLWAEDGPGAAIEKRLVSRCVQTGEPQRDTFCDELHVRALPVELNQKVPAVITYGWVFCSFPTALASDRIARAVGLAPAKLWGEARLETPVSPTRLSIFSELLLTLVESNAHHAEAVAELEKMAHIRERFLAQVSHDLRTPLSAISLRIEALLLGDLQQPEQIRKGLEAMRNSIAEETHLIEDLIDAARTRTGQFSLHCVNTQLADVLAAAIEAIRPQAAAKSIGMHLYGKLDPFESPIRADARRLQQAFWNLLSNAVKFTPVHGTVTMVLDATPDTYIVDIKDSGGGIDPAEIPSIFDDFVKSQRDNDQGLGLGLAISKRIVELHGGTIRAESAGIGHGSTFTVQLPRLAPADLLEPAGSA